MLSWSLYDWANSAFPTTVVAGFFPIFFKKFWSAGADVNVSTYQLGFANSFSSAILAILSPILGAIADQFSGKKKLLAAFAFLGIAATAGLGLVSQGSWELAIGLYVIASIGFAGSCGLYDALLETVCGPKEFDRVSALGFGLGYLGGGLLFAINVAMTLKPALFGLPDAATAVRISFVTVGTWWAIFSIPLILFVKEKGSVSPSPNLVKISLGGLRQVASTFVEIKALKNLSLFLLSYFFYIDGVNTIMRMAVDYGLALGFESKHLIAALLLTQFVAFPAAIAYGQLAHRIGAKKSLYLSILAYAGVTVFAYYLTQQWHFYALAVIIGLFQGGIQSLSRSVFASMIPEGKSGEFFGFYNMLGKFSSMVGPLLVGWVSVVSRDSRLSVLSLLLLFAAGVILLSMVRLDRTTRQGGH